jgi:cytochrome P450
MSAEHQGTAGLPVVQFDLCSQAFTQDPFPTRATLRERGPLVRARLPLLGKVWMATTYDAVNDLLRDHHRFLNNPAGAGKGATPLIMRWLTLAFRPMTTQMLLRDEPDHRRLRGLVERAFLRQSVDALRPRLAALAADMLDQRAAPAGRAPDGVDLLRHFARPFPLAVICELLGLPPEDRPRFTRWASRISTAGSFAGFLLAMPGLHKLMKYLRAEIKRQSVRPRNGLLAALIQAEEAGDRLSEDELLAMVFLLLLAGHETTLHQISGSVLALLDHPDQLRELTSDWGLAGPAVQELLRHVSFAQFTKPRFAREDVEYQGQAIGRGQMLIACLASANSDPEQFADPTRLDITRAPNRHVAFGVGIHACLGAKLARAEIEIALERLFTRFPDLHLAVPRSQVQYTKRMGSRGLIALPVQL